MSGWTDITPSLTSDVTTSTPARSGTAFVLAPYEFRILQKGK
jgi:hypothetical protein